MGIHPSTTPDALTDAGRYIILICAFLGWFCAGFHLAITSIAMQPAATDLLGRAGALDVKRFQTLARLMAEHSHDPAASPVNDSTWATWRAHVGQWFAWLQCAFLFGAATGGLAFGWLGDKVGRSRAMACSIMTYSVMAAVASLSQTTGVGGMWPNGVALVSEAWANMSRPMVAGIIGTAANVGIFSMASLATHRPVTHDNWRWMPLVAASPVLLGIFSLLCVPESPRWMATRRQSPGGTAVSPTREVFRPPLLRLTLIGIILTTIPMIGGWGSANWMVPWAGEAGDLATPPNPELKAEVQQARALTAIFGSLLGGWIAGLVGRRLTYFLISLACLAIAQYTFWFVVPTDASFLTWVSALGFVSGIYFGWLPLCLPELFPTRVRSTGGGVSFNFGRIVTAITIFATGALMSYFAGDYARIGRVTSLIFAFGLIVVAFVPDTSERQLVD
jgi:MFS family permease